MSKAAVIKERTRYKYADADEAREAKLKQNIEWQVKNKEKYAEYQRQYRAKKKLEKQAKEKLEAPVQSVDPPVDSGNTSPLLEIKPKSNSFILPDNVIIQSQDDQLIHGLQKIYI